MGFPSSEEGGRSGRDQVQMREDRRGILEDLQAKRITADEAHRQLQKLSAS